MESTVKKALKYFYEKKYVNLEEKEKEKKIEDHLKAIIPNDITKSEGGYGDAKRGYGMNFKEQSFGPGMGNVSDFIDNSGYRIVYDSFSEGLEPIYFWVLDWMRDTYWGAGMEVNKTMDNFEASVGSGYFGDLGTRASIMQDRAMKLMATINTVTRSVINILYDLKEFDQRLGLYKDLQDKDKEKVKIARLALKQFWMDKVDIQRGRGSINMLAQQLQFVTLRDAFMVAENSELKGPDGKQLDLNDRVTRLLKPRMEDYFVWEKLSGKELERRYKIEKNYLKSQIESLKLYSQWAKPYFQASKSLQSERTGTPDLVSTFNTLQVQTSLLGTKKNKDFFSTVEVSFNFRSIPHTMKQTQGGVHYAQGGRVDIQFRAFGLSKEEKQAVEEFELHEGLDMAGVNDELIKDIEDSLKDYFEGEDKEFEDPRERLGFLQELAEKEKDKDIRKEIVKDIEGLKKTIKKDKDPGPFEALFGNFKGIPKVFEKKKKEAEGSRGDSAEKATTSAYLVYNVYKKSHGMFTE